MSDTFAAMNKLGNLYAVGYLTHPAMSPAFSLTAWDDRVEHQVCYLVVDHIPDIVHERFYFDANKVNIDYIMAEHDWLCCLAYVSSDIQLRQEWDRVVHLTRDDYAALLTARDVMTARVK